MSSKIFGKFSLVAIIVLFTGAIVNAAKTGKSNLKINKLPLGNIFTTGRPIKLCGQTEGNSVKWSLKDGWQQEVSKGSIAIKSNGHFSLNLTDIPTGYYSLCLDSYQGSTNISSQVLSIANLKPAPKVDPITSPFGVCTHFSHNWPVDYLKVLKRAGIMNIRDENSWGGVEKQKGIFKFPKKYSAFVEESGRLGMDTLMIMGFGNKLYASQNEHKYWRWASPYNPEHYQAYAKYVTEVVKRYSKEIKFIEIWNEYNGGFCPGPAKGRPEIYAAMYKEAYKAVKAIRPDITVLACSTVGAPLDWIKKAVTAIGTDMVDGVAIHPYRYHIPPEGLAEQMIELRAMLRGLNNCKDIPLWVTEQGWYAKVPTSKRWNKGISRHQQACYLVRSYLEQLAGGACKIYWYVARDYPAFPTMGIVQGLKSTEGRYAPHESLPAYAMMIQKLNKAKFVERNILKNNIYHCRFAKNKKSVDVIWSTAPATAKIKAEGQVLLTDMFGKTTEMTPLNGYVYVLTEDAPFYIEGNIQNISPAENLLCQMPATSATEEPIQVSINLSHFKTGKTTIKAGTISATKTQSKFKILLPKTAQTGEYWTTISAKQNDTLFLAGTRKTKLVKPVMLSENISLKKDGLHIKLINSSLSRTFQIEKLQANINGKNIELSNIGSTLPAATSKELTFMVNHPPLYKIVPVTITVAIKNQPAIKVKRKVSISPLKQQQIVVDGNLDEWRNISGIPVNNIPYCKLQDPCKGPEDLGGTVKVCCDTKNIYISADVVDDVFSQEFNGWDAWKGDNIQLAISPLPPWGTMAAGNFLHELGMTLTSNGPEFYRFSGEGRKGLLTDIPLVVKRKKNKTIYECSIPWDAILGMSNDNPGFSFAFYINDNDGNGRKGFKKWGDIKDPKQLQFLERNK